MNIGRYLRGEDRHVGTARISRPKPDATIQPSQPDPRPLHEICVRPGHPATCAADEKVGCCYWRATPNTD